MAAKRTIVLPSVINVATWLVASVLLLMIASCNTNEYYPGAKATQVELQGEPEDSTTITLRDKQGKILVTGFNLGRYATISVEETKYANAKEAWSPSEKLVKSVAETAETQFRYNHGINVIGTKVSLVVRRDYYKDLGDGRFIQLKKGDIIPLYKPENLNLRGSEPVTEVVEGKLYYAETSVKYKLLYTESVVLVEDIQPFVAEEGYVPSFEKMIWKSWHKGPATATYANGVATVTCPDSLVAHEDWDDGSHRNWLRTTTTSKNTFSVSYNTEVASLSAVVGKTLTVKGDEASVADFIMTVTRTSKSIVEKTKSYTYDGKTINLIDSLISCGYKLKGGQVISKNQVRVDMVHEEKSNEIASFTVDPGLTEKVTLKEIERSYVHKAFRKNASVSGNDIDFVCDNDATFVKVWSTGAKDNPVVRNYTWTLKFKYSMPSGLTVDLVGQTLYFNNGKTTAEGKTITVEFYSRSISDIIFENKNYKGEAPLCSATVKSITFNSKTQATIVFEHEGETITAVIPINLIDIKVYNGKFLGAWLTDSYKSSNDFHYLFHKTTLQRLMFEEGVYVVYSGPVYGDPERRTVITESLANRAINDGKPLTYVGDSGEDEIGYIDDIKSQGDWCKIVYRKADGSLDKALSDTEHAFHENDKQFQRNPLIAVWKDGKLEGNGILIYMTGTEN